jgi:hypothetical protein
MASCSLSIRTLLLIGKQKCGLKNIVYEMLHMCRNHRHDINRYVLLGMEVAHLLKL